MHTNHRVHQALQEYCLHNTQFIPVTVILLDVSEDGLLLATVQVYSPPVVTVRVWVYCAVTGSFNTVSVPSVMTVVESLVQDTVVAGPPVEIQARVSWSESYVTSPDIVMVPKVEISEIGTFGITSCRFIVALVKSVEVAKLPPLLVYSPT